MDIRFTESASEELEYWKKNDPKKVKRIEKLCEAISTKPFEGIGKPEPHRFNMQGYWSRRITKEHRLVYTVEKNTIQVISCRFHY